MALNHPDEQPSLQDRAGSSTMVNDAPKFDLSSYISNYKGRAVFRRLFLIASCSKALREEAAKLAVIEAKRGNDVSNYNEAVALLRKVSSGKDVDALSDPSWAAQQEKKNVAETTRLEGELKGYKNNLIKESIRMGNEDLGTHYHAIGDLGNAVKAYSRMRDYCTTPVHIANTAFRIIAVAIEQRNWLAVQSQVHKIRNLQMKPEENARNVPKTTVAMGLQQMSSGDYKEAAATFLTIDPSLGDSYNDVLTSHDVAVYGGLCALASMSRQELQTKVLENPGFRNFLELEPHIRRAISFFCASKYSHCLEILDSYRADYLLDLYLQPHVVDIFQKVRTKSIVQYFQPFSKVTLSSMEKMFGREGAIGDGANGTESTSFQDELIVLIENGKLNARIDLETGVLVAKESNTRADMQQEAIRMIDDFIREARMKLLRLNVVNAGLEVKATLRKKDWPANQSMDLASWTDENDGQVPGLGSQPGPIGAGGRNILSGNLPVQDHSLRTGR